MENALGKIGDKLVILDVKIAAGQIAKYTGLEIGEIEKL